MANDIISVEQRVKMLTVSYSKCIRIYSDLARWLYLAVLAIFRHYRFNSSQRDSYPGSVLGKPAAILSGSV